MSQGFSPRSAREAEPHASRSEASLARTLGVLASVAFIVLATANSGGYRYGVADQSFYIPGIVRHLDPGSFPRDRALLEGQGRLMLVDDLMAGLSETFGVSVETLFLAGFVTTGAVLGAALWRLARSMGLSPWAACAFVAAMSLRHRVTATGVNTFEGYFHPRVLAFGLGVAAIVATLSARPLYSGLLLVGAFVLHPTTALWFGGCLTIAGLVLASPEGVTRVTIGWSTGVLAAIGVTMVGLLATGPRMDPAWVALLDTKDYVFPTLEWGAGVWATHGAIVALLVGIYLWRSRSGVVTRGETAVVIGVLALVGGFLASLVLVASRMALAVQLQTSRVLWIVETVATLYVTWALCEGGRPRPGATRGHPGLGSRRATVVAVIVTLAATGRGAYIMLAEHPGRALAERSLAVDDWTTGLVWLREHTPVSAHILADPGHAWKFGTSVRIGARRDVLLEEVKDVSMALYQREAAARVLTRIEALASFDQLGPGALEAMVSRFELDYLVGEKRDGGRLGLGQPIWQNSRFGIWRLREASE